MARPTLIMWIVLLSHTLAASGAAEPGRPEDEAGRDATLSSLTRSYFLSDEAAKQRSLIPEIKEAAGGSVQAVARALAGLQVWPALPGGKGVISLGSLLGTTVDIHYLLPEGYDSGNRYPVVLCMPDGGMSPAETLALAFEALGKAAGDFVLIVPEKPVGGTFQQPAGTAGDLRTLVRSLRRLIHTDTDRVFVFGHSLGGDAAWAAAVAHPDLFSGLIVLSSYFRVPYAQQAYPFLLENLRSVPVLSAWAAADETGPTRRRIAVAAHNRAIVALARRMALPITGLETPPSSPEALRLPADQVAAMLQRRRASPPGDVSYWFRYPQQGSVGWLRQGRFTGNVWEADQLSILPTALTDRDRFIAAVIRGKMAYLGGRFEDQTVTIETQRCARVELLIPLDAYDPDLPLTVRCNGKIRYRGMVRPSIRTLLETAYEHWEFQRFAVARVSFSIRADGNPP